MVIFICLLSVVFVVVLKMRQSKTEQKTENSLWTEKVSLNTQ